MRENSKLRNAVIETLWRNGLVGLAIYEVATGTLKDANPAFLDLLDSRYRTKKTLGLPLEQCLPEIEMGGMQEAFQRCLASGVALHLDAVPFHRGPATLQVNCILLPMTADGPAEAQAPQMVLMVASERKSELPMGESLNLVDIHARQALARRFRLSAREIDIVAECLQGKKNRQIAQDLHIGISTVKRHLESAYRKMGISSSRSLPLAILNVMRTLAAEPAGLALVAAAPEPAQQAGQAA